MFSFYDVGTASGESTKKAAFGDQVPAQLPAAKASHGRFRWRFEASKARCQPGALASESPDSASETSLPLAAVPRPQRKGVEGARGVDVSRFEKNASRFRPMLISQMIHLQYLYTYHHVFLLYHMT